MTSIFYYNLSLILGGFIALISGVVVLYNSPKKLENISWFLLTICTAVWSFGYFIMISTLNKQTAFISNQILHGGAILIPIFYFIFITELTGTFSRHKGKVVFVSILGAIFLALDLTKLFVDDVLPKFIFNYAPNAGPLYIYFTIYFFVLVIYSLFILFKTLSQEIGMESSRLKLVFFSSLVGFVGGGSVFFLTFNVNFPPYPIILFSLYPIIIAYAILKHHLFDIKVIATELLTFAIWIFLIIRALVSDTRQEMIINWGLLALMIIFGIMLIRSVLREVKIREQTEDLNDQLASVNDQLGRKTTYLESLQGLTTSIIQTMDFKTIIQSIVDGVANKFGYTGALLVLLSGDGKASYPAAISQNSITKTALKLLPQPLESYSSSFESDTDMPSMAIKTGKIQISGDFANFFSSVPSFVLAAVQKTAGIKSAIAIPVKSKDKNFGSLNVFSSKNPDSFSKEEIGILETLANEVGIVLANAQLFDEVQHLNKYKSELLSIVSHQLKNPLVAIKGFTTLVEDGTIQGEGALKDVFKKVHSDTNKLIDLLNNLLDLHHIEDGKMHYEMEKIDLNKMLGDITNDFQMLAQKKGIALSFESKVDEAFVNGDPYKISQVFRNLTDNSIKYTPKGWVKVILDKSKSGLVSVVVSDSGLGMSKELLPKLFQKFSRGVDEKQILGTGLGLYIAKEIIEAHQGKVWAESDGEGLGSQFIVELPEYAEEGK